jgi:hypothetical protein
MQKFAGLRTLTNEQLDALYEYANTQGRTWKACLGGDWLRGRTEGALQELRNTYGPSWLAKITYADIELAYAERQAGLDD